MESHQGQRSWRPAALVVSAYGLFAQSCTLSAVTLATPAISAGLGADRSQVQWVGNAFLLSVGTAMLTAGKLVDRYGPKRLFVGGCLVFGLGALLSAVSQNMPQLLAARVLQGLGSAPLVPAGLGMLARAYPGGPSRGRAVGAWFASAGLSLAVGPLGAGALVTAFGWRSLFLALAGLGALGAALAQAGLPHLAGERRTSADVLGQLLIAVTLLGSMVMLIGRGDQAQWWPVLLGLCATVLLGGCFLLVERSVSHPLLPPEILRNGGFLLSAGLVCVLFVAVNGFNLYNSVFLQQVQGRTALNAAVLLLAVAGPMLVLSPLSGLLRLPSWRYGSAAFGLLSVTGGLAALSKTAPDTAAGWLVVGYLLIGSGLGLANGVLVTLAVSSVATSRAGIASAAVQTVSLTGGAWGIGLTGALTATWSLPWLREHTPGGSPPQDALRAAAGGSRSTSAPDLAERAFTHGLHTAYGFTAGLALAGAIVAATAVRTALRVQSATAAGRAEATALRTAKREVL